MAYNDIDEEIECKIIKTYGVFSKGVRFWNKEVNLISWNGRPPKLDIRNWQRDHKKCGKGITLTREETEELVKLLNEILKTKQDAKREKPGASCKAQSSKSEEAYRKTQSSEKTASPKKPAGQRTKDAMQVPLSLEPFYRELKLFFGAGPEECKTARNNLLKKYHPDIYSGTPSYATRKTIKIKDAYEKIIKWWDGKL